MKKLVAAAALASAAVILAPSADADTVIVVPGTKTSPYPPLSFFNDFDYSTQPLIGVNWHQSSATPLVLPYPASLGPYTGITDPDTGRSIAVGTDLLEAEIKAADGPVIVSALSQGALVADATKARLADDPTAPDPEQVQVTFYEFGNPNREGFGVANLLPVGVTVPLLNYTVGATPESQYDTVVVYAQYEGWADFPNRPWNLVSVANAAVGASYLHTPSAFSAPSQAVKVSQHEPTPTAGPPPPTWFRPASSR